MVHTIIPLTPELSLILRPRLAPITAMPKACTDPPVAHTVCPPPPGLLLITPVPMACTDPSPPPPHTDHSMPPSTNIGQNGHLTTTMAHTDHHLPMACSTPLPHSFTLHVLSHSCVPLPHLHVPCTSCAAISTPQCVLHVSIPLHVPIPHE